MALDMLAEMEVPVIVSRWFHLVAVITAIGGTVFLRMVLHPSATSSLSPESHETLRAVLVRRWARVVHVCILFIILSGIYNAIVMFPKHSGQPLYHAVFGVKVLLALVLFFIATAVTGRNPAFAAVRAKGPMWMAVNIVLAAVIVLLSNILKDIPSSPPG